MFPIGQLRRNYLWLPESQAISHAWFSGARQ